MKKTILVLFVLASFILSVIALFKNRPEKVYTVKAFEKDENEEEKEIEVVDKMMYIQQYHSKLYFSGINGNDTLIKFYLHELEEKMEEIANGRIWSKKINISENIRNYGLKQLQWLRAQDNSTSEKFIGNFTTFTAACNGCHTASNHPEIKIILPAVNSFSNQDFTK